VNNCGNAARRRGSGCDGEHGVEDSLLWHARLRLMATAARVATVDDGERTVRVDGRARWHGAAADSAVVWCGGGDHGGTTAGEDTAAHGRSWRHGGAAG
jgi:hypothetical protein